MFWLWQYNDALVRSKAMVPVLGYLAAAWSVQTAVAGYGFFGPRA